MYIFMIYILSSCAFSNNRHGAKPDWCNTVVSTRNKDSRISQGYNYKDGTFKKIIIFFDMDFEMV